MKGSQNKLLSFLGLDMYINAIAHEQTSKVVMIPENCIRNRQAQGEGIDIMNV
jgi:hypothetical protein